DEDLERLLADQLGDAHKHALEQHVAGCAACRSRLAELNQCGLTLPPWPVPPERGREDTPLPADSPEQTDIFPPPAATGRSGAAPQPPRAPHPADAAPPLTARRAAAPDVTGDPPTVLAPPGEAVAPPAAFGRYRVQRVLGSGGFGAVYLGHDTELDRP